MTSFYRAVWRWHFYAGLLVLPFLVWLAVTGGLYLYKPEIERLFYADWVQVEARAVPLPLTDIVTRVSRTTGAQVSQISSSATPGESWRVTLTEGEARRTAFVDPYDGRVLGVTRQGGVMGIVKELHSLIITGPVGNALIEIAAGWTIVLVLTGVYLWWPRGSTPALALRGRPSRRLFWRDLHASVGIVAGAVVLFLAVTGMPWSKVAGGALQDIVAANGLGRPEAPTQPHHGHDMAEALPWSIQAAGQPTGSVGGDIGPDRALAAAKGRGIAAPWSLSLPREAGGPYVVSAAIVRAEDAHVVYVDAATGSVLQDAPYAGFGPAARAIEWGIAAHQGQEYGEVNRLVMLLGCIAIVLLAVSAATMWWKRREPGRLSAPPRPRSSASVLALAGGMLALGILLPLTGLTMVVALTIDLVGQRLAARA